MTLDWLDIFTTILGLIYIWLVILYWQHGLYGDAGMACYYTLAAFYGLFVWKFVKTRKKKESLPIIYMPRRQYLPTVVFFFVSWGAVYYVLITWTDSTHQRPVVCRHVGIGSQIC